MSDRKQPQSGMPEVGTLDPNKITAHSLTINRFEVDADELLTKGVTEVTFRCDVRAQGEENEHLGFARGDDLRGDELPSVHLLGKLGDRAEEVDGGGLHCACRGWDHILRMLSECDDSVLGHDDASSPLNEGAATPGDLSVEQEGGAGVEGLPFRPSPGVSRHEGGELA